MDTTSEEITRADILMAQLQNEGKSGFSGVVKGITCRLPVHQYSAIEAFSRHTGMSKNKLIVELLEVAVHDAIIALDGKNRKAFNKLQSQVLTEMETDGYGETVRDL